MTRYHIVPDRSTVVVEARSTLGPILFEALGPEGEIEIELRDGTIDTDHPVQGRMSIELERLTSGNSLYDSELLRRINAARFPTAVVELTDHSPVDETAHFVRGVLTFHGEAHQMDGTIKVDLSDPSELLITGEESIDIRQFGIPQPSMLMLRIFPDVVVRMFIAAACDDEDGRDA